MSTPTTEVETIPGLWDVTAEQYHAVHDWIGHSMLEDLRKSPAAFCGRYVTRSIQPKEPTPAMQLGSAFHAWLLERSEFSNLVAVKPADIDRRTKIGRIEWAAFVEQSRGKAIIDEEDLEKIKRMADSVNGNGLLRDMLESAGPGEKSVRWIDQESGIQCKARFDRPLQGAAYILDVKTTEDIEPDAWARTVARFGNHRQAAHYLAGWRAVWGGKPEHFHLVFSTEEPYECLVYETDALSLELGAQQNARALRRLALCRETGLWTHPLADRVTTVTLPRWEFQREEHI